MGRRKKTTKPPPKKKMPKLQTKFKCPFCDDGETVVCTMDRLNDIGNLKCIICGSEFQMAINYLLEPVDIYGEWLEACEKMERPGDYDDDEETGVERELEDDAAIDDDLGDFH